MTSSMRKSTLVWIILLAGACFIVLISAIGCWLALKPFLPTTVPSSFPNTDIIYNGARGVGFVNADGSGVTAIPLVLAYTDFYGTWQSPLMMGDGKTIFVTFTSVPEHPGKIFAVPAGEKPIDCGWNGAIQVAADGYHILVADANVGGEGIHKYLPEDCGLNNLPGRIYSRVSGALSPDEQYVAYSTKDVIGASEANIVLLHIGTGEKRIIGVGDFPVWSRDGRWLAYTGVDGIYVVQNNSDAQPKRLVPLESPDPGIDAPTYQENRFIEYYPPIASWSPDGQWLVYHVYSKNPVAPEAGAWYEHYSIFKVNVNTSETMKILDGGYSPFWRWLTKP